MFVEHCLLHRVTYMMNTLPLGGEPAQEVGDKMGVRRGRRGWR